MKTVWMGHAQAKIKPIQWADRERTKAIGFLVRCPYCMRQQWAKTDYLFVAYDGTTNNLRCKFCHICKVRPGSKLRREVAPTIESLFRPSAPGWRSLASSCSTELTEHTKQEPCSPQDSLDDEPDSD